MINSKQCKLLFLLSPAKSLNFSISPSRSKLASTTPCFLQETDKLAEILKQMTASKLKSLLKVSDSIAKENHARFKIFKLFEESLKFSHPEEGIYKQAILAYNGAAYLGLDANTLTNEELEYCHNHLVILSGFYGLIRPLDLIQPYRLDFGTRLKISDESSNLYKFWADKIAESMLKSIERGGFIINCASQEYFKSVEGYIKQQKDIRLVNCVFKDSGRIISVHAKRARGLMVRYATVNQCTTLEELKKFNGEGYSFIDSQSDETTLVFNRICKPPSKSKKTSNKRSQTSISIEENKCDEGSATTTTTHTATKPSRTSKRRRNR